jgi:hypothetical protein
MVVDRNWKSLPQKGERYFLVETFEGIGEVYIDRGQGGLVPFFSPAEEGGMLEAHEIEGWAEKNGVADYAKIIKAMGV